MTAIAVYRRAAAAPKPSVALAPAVLPRMLPAPLPPLQVTPAGGSASGGTLNANRNEIVMTAPVQGPPPPPTAPPDKTPTKFMPPDWQRWLPLALLVVLILLILSQTGHKRGASE